MENAINIEARKEINNIIGGGWYYHQAIDFVRDWLCELKKSSIRATQKKPPYKHGAVTRTLRKWAKMWSDQEVSDIYNQASKVIKYLKEKHPFLQSLK